MSILHCQRSGAGRARLHHPIAPIRMPEPPASVPVPEDLIAAWRERGWPLDLLQSAFDLHISRRQIEWWLRQDDRGLERARNHLPQLQELTLGSIRGREATYLDNDRFSD